MKKILLSIFFFVAALFVADRLFYYFFNKYVFMRTLTGEEGAGQVNYFLQNGRMYNCVIMGTSRAKLQIDPAKLTAIPGKTYNEGVNGIGKAEYNDMVIDLFLNKGVCPKYIILQTDADNLVQRDDFPTLQIKLLFPFIGQSARLDHYIHDLSYEEKLKLYLLKSYRFNGRFLNILYNLQKRKSAGKNYGFTPKSGVMDSITTAKDNVKSNYSGNRIFIPEMKNALSDIIENCAKNNIRLFIVLPPRFNNNDYDPLLLQQFMDTFKNADIIDMSDITRFPDIQSRYNWLDDEHLNGTGADKFSTYLNDSLAKRLN